MMKKTVFIIIFYFFSFSLFPAEKIVDGELNFVHITDVHVSPGRDSEKKLHAIVEEINSGNFDFVILSGDLTNVGSDAELLAVKSALEKLKIPYYVVSGNHETNWSESVGETFRKLFGDDRFVFEAGDFLFVGFATGPYMRMGDGHIKEEDLARLKKTLEENKSKNKRLITVAHYPLSDGLDNWYKATDLIKAYNPAFALCGHGHDLSLHNFDGILGAMGRATYERNKPKVAGYNLIKIKADSVFFFQKIIGSPEAKLYDSFDIKNAEEKLKNLPPASLRPDFSVNNEFPDISQSVSVESQSSVFTAALPTDKGFVFANSMGEISLWKLKADKPTLKWRRKYKGPIYSNPALYKNLLVFGAIDGYLYALNVKNGKEIWSQFLEKPIIAEIVVDADHLFVSAGSNMYKMNATDGKIIWKNDDAKGQLQGKAWVDEDDLIFGAWDTYLYCLNKNTGALKWKWTNGNSAVLLSPGNVSPVAYEEKVFIVAPDRYMTAINKKTGETVWRTKQHKVRESMGISQDGSLIYAKLMNDSIIAVAATPDTFKLEWSIDAGFAYDHNPCPLFENDGVVYAGGKNGLLVAIDRKTQQIKWKHKAGNSAINKICADKKGNIWISLVEGKILRFGKKK